MKSLLVLLFLSTTPVLAADDSCAYFKYCGGANPTNTSSSTTSPSINPSNIARIKGLGLETLIQQNNPLGFSLVTGTGNVGAALVSSSSENSFFGNRSLELDADYYFRYRDKVRYQNKKLSFAFGAKILDRNNIDLDVGISLKRHSQLKKINPGVAFSLKFPWLTFGAHIFKDDVKLELQDYRNPYTGFLYSETYNSTTYQENYLVTALTMGLKIQKLTFDIGYLQTRYKFYNEDTTVMIYSLGYTIKNLHINAALRSEISPNLAVKDEYMIIEKNKKFSFLGLEYMLFKQLMLGVGYNTFLMNEYSATVTIFLN